MCVTSASARLSNTRILSLRLNGQKHLLAYSNKVENTAGVTNCMILPVPGRLTEADFVDTSGYPDFLATIERELTPRKLDSVSKGARSILIGASRAVQHFKSGMYEVFVTRRATARGGRRTGRATRAT